MTRPLRIQYENALYHIMSRGDQKRKIFLTPKDYEKFLEILLEAKHKYGFFLYAYALMDNHYHLLLETPHGNLNKIMHTINSAYPNYFNKKNKRVGHVFQGRYKAILVEKDIYLKTLIQYIHQNPLRKNLANDLSEYPWTSYRDYISKNEYLIDCQWMIKRFGNKKSEALKYLLKFMCEPIKKDDKHEPYAGLIMGSEKFIKTTLCTIAEEKLDIQIGNRRSLADHDKTNRILRELEREFEMDVKDFKSMKFQRNPIRNFGIYFLKKYSNLSNQEIGDIFGGISLSGVSKSAKRFEISMTEAENNRVKAIKSIVKL